MKDAEYKELWYRSSDDWRLYARDYPCRTASETSRATSRAASREGSKGTVLCLHGLTRSCADFHRLAIHLQQRYRVLTVDQRGRGRSDYGDLAKYKIDVYVRDMFTLLDRLMLDKLWLIGTSMGGIIAMSMASRQIDRFHGVVLNDIGPEISRRGIRRISNYIRLRPTFKNWKEAVWALKWFCSRNFPDFSEEEWVEFARNTCRAEDGKLVLNYDEGVVKSARSSLENVIPNNAWDVYDSAISLPILLIRGELSDIVSSDCIAKMRRRKPDLQVCNLPNRGHAPTLNEPAARDAIDRFLQAPKTD